VTRVIAAGIAVVLFASLLPALAFAEEKSPASPGETVYVPGETDEEIVGGLRLAKGKHGRKLWRSTRWSSLLTGDKAEVFDAWGMPSSRYREEKMGRVTETWTYQDQGVEITFEGAKTIRTRRFPPGTR